ncbi:MAG: hypothetical protein U0T07_01940 [Chitinophagales bacterium]
MLSPDDYVQDPTNLHTFNRYSYVMNNPLKYTDPSGQILKYVAEGREIEFPESNDKSGGGGGRSSKPPYGCPKPPEHSGSSNNSTPPSSGYVIIYIGSSGNYSFTNFNVVSNYSNITFENTQLYNGVGGSGRSSIKQTFFNNGVSSQRDVIDMNTATACNGCDNIGLNTSAPRTGFFNKTLNYVNNHKLDIIGTFGGAAEYELGRRLSKPMFKFYQPLRLSAPGWSKYSSKIEPFASEFLSLSKYAKGFKAGGIVLGGIGIGMSFYGLGEGIIEGNNSKVIENSLDIIMGGVGFIPGWGWAASGAYFLIAKPLYNHYIRKEGE